MQAQSHSFVKKSRFDAGRGVLFGDFSPTSDFFNQAASTAYGICSLVPDIQSDLDQNTAIQSLLPNVISVLPSTVTVRVSETPSADTVYSAPSSSEN